ncbi:MAG TPA: ferritin-like domain-containing protein [bacterium]|nr:ferritin-like domain-containing protein [bacterium]
MKLTSLQDLFFEELKDIYDAEKRIVEALPNMAKEVSSQELAKAIREHLEVTKEHVTRLEQVFAEIGRTPARKKCEGMVGLLEEGKEVLAMDGEPVVKDAAIIAAAQRVEHYEIAGYGCLRTWSEILGYDEASRLLEQTLDEEKDADEVLTDIAETINPEAADEAPAGGNDRAQSR